MLEATVEDHLVERVKEIGGEVRKVKWIGRRHAPDRVVMLPSRFSPKWDGKSLGPGTICYAHDRTRPAATIWVELKAPGKKPRPGQVREHQRMRDMGQDVRVLDTIEAVDKFISEV